MKNIVNLPDHFGAVCAVILHWVSIFQQVENLYTDLSAAADSFEAIYKTIPPSWCV